MIRAIIARSIAIAIVIVGLVLMEHLRAEPMRGHPIGKECDDP